MNFENVTVKNSLMYAAHNYDNPQCLDTEEFIEDYKRFKYIKRLARRYLTTKRLSERLLLNHLVLLNNVFGPVVTTRLLFIKCDDDVRLFAVLKPFLQHIGILPEVVQGVSGVDIITSGIPLDELLLRRIQEL